MTERPQAEAISYIPVGARKEAVGADELKTLSINASFHCTYHQCLQSF
jgi:hypothetical protein